MTFGENIVSVYDRATDAEREAGMAWYNIAHDFALSLDPNNVWRAAGVIAALSPNKQWNVNVAIARKSFETGIVSGSFGVMNSQGQRIFDGEHPLDVLNGDKVRSFCEAIATNGNGTIATVDRHAHDIAMGRVFTEKERKIGKVLYRTMAMHYSEAAKEVGVSVNQIQAITWVRWRNEKGIVG